MSQPTGSTETPAKTTLEVVSSLREVPEKEWNALERGDFIFADHRFLLALEDSGSLGERTGWFPVYLLLKRHARIEAALPLFVKNNSYGEFIFDWSWASAAARAGLPYYPKLTAAIPFTPATGPKFLTHPDANAVEVRELLLAGARELKREAQATSLHFLFTTEEETKALKSQGLIDRHTYQYHWKNEGGWKTFDDFLQALRSKRRNEIRRERNEVAKANLRIETLTGSQLTEKHARQMYGFYASTTDKMGAPAYLTSEFFELLFERMPENLLLVLAYDPDGPLPTDEPVAGALSLYSGQTLYGRNWGCHADYRQLHFELCYYRGIDWALANGVTLFEAGAQGEHKFNRGFQPSLTYSAHEIDDEDLRRAVHRSVEHEKRSTAELFSEYKAHDPFKRTQ